MGEVESSNLSRSTTTFHRLSAQNVPRKRRAESIWSPKFGRHAAAKAVRRRLRAQQRGFAPAVYCKFSVTRQGRATLGYDSNRFAGDAEEDPFPGGSLLSKK